MWVSVFIITALAIGLGIVLGYAAQRYRVKTDPVIEKIDALLPQTQCGQCDYPGCRPYAQAIANDQADINQCPPGGEATIRALASLLAKEYKPLKANLEQNNETTVAIIDEDVCIGCTLCIQACPVDAILGTAKHMHTVLSDLCTGCDLCLPPCPVDCIDMIPIAVNSENWQWPKPDANT